jgi:predicted nucleic acid-binding Zn ribbon protein
MPTYTYEEILPDGSAGTQFEVHQAMSDAPLTQHPHTGKPIRKVLGTPAINSRYSEKASQQALDNKNLTQKGFTKYEKDKLTGRYHKTAGSDPRAPDVIERPDRNL